MRWIVEYYEQADAVQPAEEFEDSLKRHYKKLGAKLRAIAAAIEVYGPQLGGGLIEPCHDYKGLWEIRTIFASIPDLKQAYDYWRDYQYTHKVSPEEAEKEVQ